VQCASGEAVKSNHRTRLGVDDTIYVFINGIVLECRTDVTSAHARECPFNNCTLLLSVARKASCFLLALCSKHHCCVEVAVRCFVRSRAKSRSPWCAVVCVGGWCRAWPCARAGANTPCHAMWLQALKDKAVGTLLLAASVSIFVYYTLWVLVTVR